MGRHPCLPAGTAAPELTKTCSLCRQEKSLDHFYKGTGRFGKQSRCKDCVNHRSRENQQLYNRRGKLKRQYQLSLEEYDALLSQQNNCCAVCKTKEPGGNSPHFKIDHDHRTGLIRGLLCNRCNSGLGHFRDNPVTLHAAAEYLRQQSPREDPTT